MPPSRFTVALGAASLLLGAIAFDFNPPMRSTLPPVDFCPTRCSDSGANTGNWTVYANFNRIKKCQETMFYTFGLHDPVDDRESNHRISACSSFGSDFDNMPPEPAPRLADSASSIDVDFQVGWWEEGFGLASGGLRSLVEQLREYINQGSEDPDQPFIVYGRSGQATVGLYIGQSLLNQGLSNSALQIFQDNFDSMNVTTPSLAMQLCEAGYSNKHIFGIAVTSNGTFTPIQNMIKTWHNATCVSFEDSIKFPGQATFTTPLVNGTASNSTILHSSAHARHNVHGPRLQARADCRTVQVEPQQGCAELAVKCGISGADFTKYNPGICGSLKAKQHVCCSSGTLPDIRPKPGADGHCHAYTVTDTDDCASITAEYGLKDGDLKDFNKDTWGFSGCDPLFAKITICLSTGKPPFPAEIPGAICGPGVKGSKPPTDGTKTADMNQCPLNACCNIWGQCGITRDFCIDTNTGPPGTAKKGTYGCISNCGLDIVKGTGSGAIKLAYFQGYGMGRPCLYQDALQIDTSKYTHLHFGFGTLTPSFEVEVGDALSSYQFNEFKRIRGAKRILSFGGWSFSTFPETYLIFRNGVKAANRMKMATNIANFIKKHELDGVDIDWEYPGAPDLPDFDPGTKEDGPNYQAFLAVLKNLLPGKTVAIAAPASYWYLKQFPIKEILRIVDYIVYMTYDLHGQWDAHNEHSQEGCDTGNCLRSQVNLTETRQSLAMITKAGVPGSKIVVGVTSYGRSFAMETPGCWGPTCKFTGDRETSFATPGRCTGTGGYIADAEIAEIISGGGGSKRQSSRVVTHFVDASSNSDILVYDNNQWVGYMSESTKAVRARLYASLGMGGTTDWASDLQKFNDPPKPAKNWASYISLAASGENPKEDTTTNIGKWKEHDCKHPAIAADDLFNTWYPSDRWKALDASSAWNEVVKKWFETDQFQNVLFVESLQQSLKMGASLGCEALGGETDKCHGPTECEKGLDGDRSGPAAQLIWDSLISIHLMHHTYWNALVGATGQLALGADHMEDTFAPIPEEKTNQWLNILIDFLTIGTLSVAAPFFNGFMKSMAAFSSEAAANNAKDTALTLIGQSTTLAKDMLQSPKQDDWTPQEQNKFSHYLGEAIFGWMENAERSLGILFNGSPESVKILGKVIANGNLIEGKRSSPPSTRNTTATDLTRNVLKTFYGFGIPTLWRRSKTYAFVLDSGSGCSDNPSSKYVDDDTAEATSHCYNGRKYYLVHPDGDAVKCHCEYNDGGPCQRVCIDQKFSAPVGLDELGSFSLSVKELIEGSVRTWKDNGEKNGAGVVDPIKSASARNELFDMDITTPGLVRLPVCSGARAWQSWDTGKKGGSDHYPCDIPPGKNYCGASDFENRSSGASPLVKDCEQIIRNIEGDGGTDFTRGITGHHTILEHGTCHFGVERTGGTGGAVMFKVGGQDVIDVINDAISRFGGERIGARGTMPCDGTTASTTVNVLWGIY